DAPGAEADLHPHRVADGGDRWRSDVVDVDIAVARVVGPCAGWQQGHQREADHDLPYSLLHRGILQGSHVECPGVSGQRDGAHGSAHDGGSMMKQSLFCASLHGLELAEPGSKGRCTLSPLLL